MPPQSCTASVTGPVDAQVLRAARRGRRRAIAACRRYVDRRRACPTGPCRRGPARCSGSDRAGRAPGGASSKLHDGLPCSMTTTSPSRGPSSRYAHAPGRADREALRGERVVGERALRAQARLRRCHQTTSAIEQFRPEPMPSSAMRSPFFRRPISRSLRQHDRHRGRADVAVLAEDGQHLLRVDAEGLDEGLRCAPG